MGRNWVGKNWKTMTRKERQATMLVVKAELATQLEDLCREINVLITNAGCPHKVRITFEIVESNDELHHSHH